MSDAGAALQPPHYPFSLLAHSSSISLFGAEKWAGNLEPAVTVHLSARWTRQKGKLGEILLLHPLSCEIRTCG